MFKDRVVVRSEKDNHVLFKVFKAYYPYVTSEIQPYYEHHHSELEILAIQSGSGCYSCSGEKYDFQTGDVFMHCGNDIHFFQRINRERCLSLLVIQFEPRFIWTPGGEWFDSKYLQIFMGNNHHISRHIPCESPTAREISGLLVDSFQECQIQQPAYDMYIKANLLKILAHLARYYHNDLSSGLLLVKTENMKSLERSIDYILCHLEEELTLDKLAKEAGMSRSYYSTMFKLLNGVSPWNYITNQRIDRAQQMLEKSNMSVIEIGQNCGFCNISNFNRAFKKVTGKTPREYRSEVKGLTEN